MVIPVSRMRSRFFLAICLLLLFTGSVVFAQQPTRIELLNADVSEFDESLEANALRLIGNVAFRHEGATMQCDSAYLYRDDNRLEAFSRINMRQGDSLQLRGKHLYYDGNTKIAQVFEDVVLSDGRMTLHTRQLDYNLGTEIASYTDSAMILDGDNRLSSKTGYYYSDRRDLYFKQNVLLVNPRYTLTCDTLRYNTVEKTAYFLGPTRINSSSNTMYCEQGWYNTNSQQTSFQGNSYLLTRTQLLRGDSVLYDRSSGIGRVFGHVSITDTVNRLIIRGDYGEHHELTDSSWVTGNAELVQIFDTDSLFMHADTLLATAADSLPAASGDTAKQNNRNLFAFHHVRLFKPDLQGRCDSIAYTLKDSTLRMFRDPVLWSGLNQLTADSIDIIAAGGGIHRLYLVNSAFIASRADSSQTGPIDSLRFNQVRGKTMTGYFIDNNLYRIDVSGNGQTIYYARNKEEKNFAVNRADCSDMTIYLEENKVKGLSLLQSPEGVLYPVKQISTRELRLKGFNWKEAQRPIDRAAIFR